jgi:hypothetical protein
MRIWACISAAVLFAAALLAGGCTDAGTQGATSSQLAGITRPAPWNRSTPENGIKSYLDWTSYAYRIANSDVATPTMSPEEEVRVNSYVQLNNEKQRFINQKLDSLTLGKPSIEGTRAIVTAREAWQYSYISKSTSKSISPTYSVSYESTYTVVQPIEGVWVVDSVQAVPNGEVK